LQDFGRKTLRRDYLEYLGIDGRIILKWILKKYDRRTVEWVDLAEDRDKRRTRVNMILKLRVLQIAGKFAIS
jgi:hypothetical protein